ncbi:MAG: 50S ribosomal protein L24, partial [Zetaproteobacteria bacterium]|nr:50S ribosomal protein L24 [Zetaproteobacteria bacterium]
RMGDQVAVTAGACKGEQGKITRINKKAGRVFIEGVNVGKRHKKPTQEDPNGGIQDFARSIAISNVSFVDPQSKKPTRLGYKMEDGKKVRFAKQSGTIV